MRVSAIKSMVAAAAAAVCIGAKVASAAPQLGDVFYILLENHDFTEPGGTSPEQLLDNPAAPYLNSLVTPGNPNAADVSYATNYTNAGAGDHPSEPNYVWAEAGTNFNPALSGPLQNSGSVNVATSTNQGVIDGTTILNDNDPSASSDNILTVPHLTGELNAAGISWKNYQEDYQVSGQGPLVSSSGTYPGGATNAYNGSTQYNYAVKHNPAAFFSDTATENVYPISQLATDLSDNATGRFNYITPDQYNDMHSALNAGFTYHGTHYTGDQAAIAEGDNFLSIVVPQIEASQAFQNNGAIVIWTDETEGGDSSAETLPEVLISPLAKGNAYAGGVAYTHSSDLKTMDEIFGLPLQNNPIPSSETSANGGYSTVIGANDLSDLFQPGTISVPEPATISVLALGGIGLLARRKRA